MAHIRVPVRRYRRRESEGRTLTEEGNMYRITKRYRVHRPDGTVSAYSYLHRSIEAAKESAGYVAENGRVIYSTTAAHPIMSYAKA